MWASASAQASVLSETWGQNLDLTIPSSEMPLTWELDLKDKHEIMMGWTCCYRKELIDYVHQEHSRKLIGLKLKEKQKRLRFIPVKEEPSEKQLKYYYWINFLDMTGSYYFIKNNPNIKEGNFLLPEKPSAAEFILHKSITTPFVAQNVDTHQMVVMNSILTMVVIRNFYLYKTTSPCPSMNFHVDGYCVR